MKSGTALNGKGENGSYTFMRVTFMGLVKIKLLHYLIEFSAMKKLFEKSSVLLRGRKMVRV